MDNAAYFFTGVLAGIAGLTLLAVLDSKYGFITGTPTACDIEKSNTILIIRDNSNKNTDKTQGDSTGSSSIEQPENTEDTDTDTPDTENPNPTVPPIIAVA